MKNRFKKILLITLALMFVLLEAVPTSSFAEVPPYSDEYESCKITVNGKKISDEAMTVKGNVYIQTDTLKKYGDISKLNIDTKNQKISFKLSDLSLNFGNEEVNSFIKNNAGECYIPIKSFTDSNDEKKDWVAVGPIAQLAKFAWAYADGKLTILQYEKANNLASVNSLTDVVPSLNNPGMAQLFPGEKVFIASESNAFSCVETIEGNRYYVLKENVSRIEDISSISDFEYIPSAKDHFNTKINLAWLNLADNATRTPLPPEANEGLDVLSPSWMHQVVNGKGSVKHICDYGFIQLAHKLGYKVWIMANNCFTTTGSTKYTTSVMADVDLSNKVIAQYLFYACLYGADGINLDYEDLVKADRDDFTAFNETLAYYCNLLGLTYSVDTSIPTSYNTMYDWEALGSFCDYIIPMTYVETLGSTDTPGSISSYAWYSKWVNKMCEMIPSEKILLGTPFFTRYWYLNPNGKIATPINSNTGTVSLKRIAELIEENEVTVKWDSSKKQYKLMYANGEKTVVMWTEDERSMGIRLEYVMDANLGGTACWALDQQDGSILSMFEAVYKNGIDPRSIDSKYK